MRATVQEVEPVHLSEGRGHVGGANLGLRQDFDCCEIVERVGPVVSFAEPKGENSTIMCVCARARSCDTGASLSSLVA